MSFVKFKFHCFLVLPRGCGSVYEEKYVEATGRDAYIKRLWVGLVVQGSDSAQPMRAVQPLSDKARARSLSEVDGKQRQSGSRQTMIFVPGGSLSRIHVMFCAIETSRILRRPNCPAE